MRYFIGFLVTIGLIFLLIFMLFQGGDDKTVVENTEKTLVSYADSDTDVRLTIDGPVDAAQEHKQTRITVGRDTVTLELIRGYDGDVAKQQSFPNTKSAYSTFLLALNQAGFTLGNKAANLRDERGYCAQSNRYIYELEQNGQSLQRFWSSDCGNLKTYQGNSGATIDLFRAQVPNYSELAEDFPS